MIEIYVMNDNGIALIDTVAYSEWMAFFASAQDQYEVDGTLYSKDDLIPLVAEGKTP